MCRASPPEVIFMMSVKLEVVYKVSQSSDRNGLELNTDEPKALHVVSVQNSFFSQALKNISQKHQSACLQADVLMDVLSYSDMLFA